MIDLPASFQKTIVDLYSERGQVWLQNLPDIISDLEARWSIRVLPHFKSLSYNYAAPAVCSDGTPAVVKLGVPNPEITTECEALRVYNGQGIVQLYEADIEKGALLIERLLPGVMLSEQKDDEQATSVIIDIIQNLWRPLPEKHPFPLVTDWGKNLQRLRSEFNGGTGPFPEHLVAFAEETYAEMHNSPSTPVLLHGDLHHYNILSAQRQPWLAIDPKGLVGEPGYDVAQMLLNPCEDLSLDQLLELAPKRINQLSAGLGIDRLRLIQLAATHTILSAWWSYEDHGEGWESGVAIAEMLASLL